ncbi:MAG: Oligosaccharides import ATP-binding protein MsmX [Chroococcopsis gigantea SAG 12.99]|jgi:multiple sugar transport system ATP-binding protein|nr:ABC transporter ATP-binding protein [Chlorogloea purpurea SAG 13.99]MDV3001865.1 Oligosaccharides import ATP-binding protein MsmX [Chroococcopsis gigantea SAG 12.99]
MATLQLDNIRKEYNSSIAPVKSISFSVKDGEFLTLLGPSGCGKSTLLRLVAGLETPTRGRIFLNDKLMNKMAPGDRDIAMVFQSYALYPHMTVRDNISACLKLRRLSPDKIRHRVEDVSDKLDLNQLLERKPGQLSGGQRQRVALARALVRQPNVFLLDEPLSNLDALLREQVRGELKQLFKEQNRPVIYVTHDQTEAMTLSTKIAVLSDGFIQQLATPDDIYKMPTNQFIAAFVGSPGMNLLELNCQENEALLGENKLPLPRRRGGLNHVIFGIRPEDISLTPLSNFLAIKGKIYLEEKLGKEKLITFTLKNTPHFLKALVNIDQPMETEETSLYIPSHKIHWFNWDGDPNQPLEQRNRL